ncbi:hypothetical protein Tco_0977799 [Tanacetum coccineum]|uniref:Uncharacterized protein n=1 Tax=Tanacetum coccineum TaxID=301880 RepID=A0ABQ5EM69_9ASTR
MIGGLMYFTASRLDIAFAIFVCACYQAHPTVKHLKGVKRIFRYLRQTINMGLWYSKYSGFELIAYSDADHTGCNDDCKSTSGGIQFLGDKLFWKTVSKVLDTKDTIKFELNSQEIVYTVDIFRDTLHLPVETLENPFIAPVNIKTMFKVFNRCLTTQTSGHDQTKINILHLFHVVVNRVHVDYAALLWWDFLNWMLISDAFLTNKIHATDDYAEYETVFVKVVVPTIQSQPVVSTQGTHRTIPSAHRSPTLTAAGPQKKKKRKQNARETSSPRKSLNVTIRQQKQSTTLIPPPSDDREKDEMAEATLLSLTLHKTVLAAEAQENIAKVQEKLVEEEIEKIVEGKDSEESYASEFSDSIFNDDDDFGTRIEPKSNKEHPKNIDDDDEIEKEKKDDKKDDEKAK